MNTLNILDEIKGERERQNKKWGIQHHPDFTNDEPYAGVLSGITSADLARVLCENKFEDDEGSWFDIAREEFWEAIDEARSGNKDNLRKELIQLAAVCVAWVEDLDRHE